MSTLGLPASTLARMALCVFACLILGCGESTKDAMIRIATQRAAAREAEEAEEAAAAAEAAKLSGEQAAAAEPSPAEPATPQPATTQPQTVATPAPATAPTSAVASSTQSSAVPAAPPAMTSELQPPASETGSAVIESRVGELHVSPFGKWAVSFDSEDSIEVFDLATKASIRKFYTWGLRPSCVAFSDSDDVYVGTLDGGIKQYSISSLEGLDEFTKKRMLRSDAEAPRKVHTTAVTAISVGKEVCVSGDSAGELRFWNPRSVLPQTLGAVDSRPLFFQPFQQDRVLFAACDDGSIRFWQRAADGTAIGPARQYAKLSEEPVAMKTLPGGKGLAVADSSGLVSLSLPTEKGVDTSTHQLSRSKLVNMAFARNGKSLVFATRDGQIAEQTLPIPVSKSFPCGSVEPTYFGVSDSLILSGSASSTLDVFTQHGQPLKRFSLPSNESATAAIVSADRNWLVVGNESGQLGFYSFATAQIAATLTVSTSRVLKLLPSSDSSELLFVCQNGEIGCVPFPIANNTQLRPLFSGVGNVLSTQPGHGLISITVDQQIKPSSTVEFLPFDQTKRRLTVRVPDRTVTAASLSGDEVLLGFDNGELQAWDLASPDTPPKPLEAIGNSEAIIAVGRDASRRIVAVYTSGKFIGGAAAKSSDGSDWLAGLDALSGTTLNPAPTAVASVGDKLAWVDQARHVWITTKGQPAEQLNFADVDTIAFAGTTAMLGYQAGQSQLKIFDLASRSITTCEVAGGIKQVSGAASGKFACVLTNETNAWLVDLKQRSEAGTLTAVALPRPLGVESAQVDAIGFDDVGEKLWAVAGSNVWSVGTADIELEGTGGSTAPQDQGKIDFVTSAAISVDGIAGPAKSLQVVDSRVVLLDAKGKLSLLDPQGQSRAFSDLPTAIELFGAASGKLLVRTSSGLVVLDPMTQTTEEVAAAGSSEVLSFHPFGSKWLAVDARGQITSIATQAENQPNAGVPSQVLADLSSPVAAARILKDQVFVASESKLVVMDTTGRTLKEVKTDGAKITRLAVSPSGLAVAFDERGRLWSLDAAGPTVLPSGKPIVAVAWQADDDFAVASSSEIFVWNARTKLYGARIDSAVPIESLLVGADGKVWVKNKQAEVLDSPVLVTKWKMSEGQPLVAALSVPAKRRLLVGTESGQLWNIDSTTGTLLNQIDCGSAGCKELVYQSSAGSALVVGAKSQLSTYAFEDSVAPIRGGDQAERQGFVADPRSDMIFAVNARGQIQSSSLSEMKWQPRSTDVAVSDLAMVGLETLVGLSSDSLQVILLPTETGHREIHQATSGILSFDWATNDRVCVYVDGSNQIRLQSAVSGELTKDIPVPNSRLLNACMMPDGERVVVGGQRLSGEHFVGVWLVAEGSLVYETQLKKPIRFIASSDDANRFGVVTEDGSLTVFSRDGLPLESFPEGTCATTFAFSTYGKHVLTSSSNSSVVSLPLGTMSAVEFAETSVQSVIGSGRDERFLAAANSKIALVGADISVSGKPVVFAGAPAALADAQMASDGLTLIALGDLANGGKVTKWDVPSDLTEGKSISAKEEIGGASPSTCVGFTSDSRFVLLGGADGIIRAWSLADKREVARFVGHEGKVVELKPLSEPAKFVSLGADKSLRSWTFPANLPGSTDEVPEGSLSATGLLEPSTDEQLSKEILEEDPLDTARRALFSGSGREEAEKRFFSEIDGDIRLKEAARDRYSELKRVEQALANGDASPSDLALARKNYAVARRELLPLSGSGSSTSIVDDHANLLFSAPTNFNFASVSRDSRFRPVELRLSEGRYVYAARASDKKQFDENGQQISGEDGYVLNWDFGYSGIQAYSWSFPELYLDDVYSAPNNDGIFTGPNLTLFANDGSSRVIAGDATKWVVSPDSLSTSERLLVIGKAGPLDRESAILQVYRASDLSKQSATPIASFAAFDGVITALAFANKHAKLAFAVRDRATTKVYLADPTSLNANSLKLLFQHSHAMPYRSVDEDQGLVPIAGVTSLAFSPNDEVLVSHCQFEKPSSTSTPEFRFKGWLLEWSNGNLVSNKNAFTDFISEGPLINDASPLSIRFVKGANFSLENYLKLASRSEKQGSSRAASASMLNAVGDLLVVFENGGAANVLSLIRSRIVATVPLTDTQRGQAAYSITQDGRWLITGNDQGLVSIWDLLSNKQFPLTLNNRPAHTGPVVGVVLSETDAKLGFPEFAATAGEENQIKVWDLIPVLKQTE